MALTDKLTAIANAIRAKTGRSATMTLAEMPSEIASIPSGSDPVINPLSITANGTYTAPSGVDGYSPINVNVPQGITPTGNINITDTNVTDVTNYATAQVVDADLVASNIKEGVNILGILGTFAGGGGSLPSVISKIDGGSFTFASNKVCNTHSITHNLGEIPKGAFVWSDDMTAFSEQTTRTLVYALASFVQFDSSSTAKIYAYIQFCYRGTNGSTSLASNQATSEAQKVLFVSNSNFSMYFGSASYKENATYKWIAWA